MDHTEAWPRGATPSPRSGAATESARLPWHRGGREELPNVRGQGRGREELPHARGQGMWPRGATPRPRSGGAAVRRYPSSKVRAVPVLSWSSHEEIPQVQGKRNPSKMVGVERGHQRADTLKP